jgi:hypothetical protein
MPTTTAPLDKPDRQIAAIGKMMQEEMRLLIETRKDIRTLAAMQKKTTANVDALTADVKALAASLRGGNGHTDGDSKSK